jgi:phosphatidylserine decarboxylase
VWVGCILCARLAADAVSSGNLVYYNQRQVVVVDTPAYGPVAVVAIGATCVGSVIIGPSVNTTLAKGDELGRFEYGGSTLLLLFPPGAVAVPPDLAAATRGQVETFVLVGTEIGRDASP